MLSDCQPVKNQVGTESVHESNQAAAKWTTSCDVCVEENKVCRCYPNGTGEDDTNNVEHRQQSNSSFAHAVINMIGMLIGKILII